MNAVTRRELAEELRSQHSNPECAQRYCRYALDILLDGADRQVPEEHLDPDFEPLEAGEREAYLAAQAARLGPALQRFVQGWCYTDLEHVEEWKTRTRVSRR